mgnify:CR=1 FL=1
MEKLQTEDLEAQLATKHYEKKYTNVPNKAISETKVRYQLERILNSVGKAWDDDDSYLVIKAEEGVFNRLFLPTVYNCELPEGNVPALRFSNKTFISLQQLEEVGEIDFDDRTFVFLLDDGKGEELMAKFHLFTEDGENPPEKMEIKQAYKKGNLSKLLANEPKMVLRKKLQELNDGDSIKVVGFTSIPTKFGEMYSLQSESGEEYLANTSIKKILQANPEISPGKPARCTVLSRRENRNGNIVVNASLEVDDNAFGLANSIDLSF